MSSKRNRSKIILKCIASAAGISFIGLSVLAKFKKAESVYKGQQEQKNPFQGKTVIFVEESADNENADGVRGHLELVGNTCHKPGIYEMYIKRAIDIVLSFAGLIALSPVFAGIAIAIRIDDPGPVIFTQKRVGKDKEYFKLHKFRTMKMCAPHDIPTHMLENPEQYITRVGGFLRKYSLDELPQIWDIFVGNLSIIGPRPGLWNQDCLIAARDKYGANDVKPGLTGWAQINGRDKLEIPDKALLDGEYVERMGLLMDVKCFLGTIGSVISSDGVAEGGTGEIHKMAKEVNDGTNIAEGIATVYTNVKRNVQLRDNLVKPGSQKPKLADQSVGKKKRVLITGTSSYVGVSVENWLGRQPDRYEVTEVNMLSDQWKKTDFSNYDVVYHVAGIAHADNGDISEEQKKLYYQVNTDLAVEVARTAKLSGVKQFIFMSSMIIYSGCKEKIITAATKPKPLDFYGDSKWKADQKIYRMGDKDFKVVILRAPMIYGKGSKGNYPKLAKLAAKLPIFPLVENRRSVLHIDNLCQFVKLMIDNEESGVFFPQNGEYTSTSDLVQIIALVRGHPIIMVPGTEFFVRLMGKVPGKIGWMFAKAFGDSAYDMGMSEYRDDYRINTLWESIQLTEGPKR